MAVRIDAHQHFWRPARGDYGWLTADKGVLFRNYMPSDLRPSMDALGISRTILVQAAPSLAETEFMLGLAARHDWIAGVVGWLDFDSDGFAGELEQLASNPRLVGLRPMLQDLDDDRFILRPRVLDNLRRVADSGLVFEYLTFPRHLPHVADSLAKVPGLRAILDHVSKPPIAMGDLSPWREGIEAVACFPNLRCKISGMVTEADHANWTVDDLRPYVRVVLDLFGPGRLVWGSDWPVCLLAADYRTVHDTALQLLQPDLSVVELADVFGGNAARLYRLT